MTPAACSQKKNGQSDYPTEFIANDNGADGDEYHKRKLSAFVWKVKRDTNPHCFCWVKAGGQFEAGIRLSDVWRLNDKHYDPLLLVVKISEGNVFHRKLI